MEQPPLIPEAIDERPPANGAARGRPPGAGNLRYRALRRAAEHESLPIVLKLCEMAKDGDVLAARIILDRVWPRPKGAPLAVDLAPTRTPDELRAAMHDLLRRVTSGEIPPEDGAALIAIMRDILTSHKVDTLSPVVNIEINQSSARDALAERLARAVEERRRQIENGREPAPAPDNASD